MTRYILLFALYLILGYEKAAYDTEHYLEMPRWPQRKFIIKILVWPILVLIDISFIIRCKISQIKAERRR